MPLRTRDLKAQIGVFYQVLVLPISHSLLTHFSLCTYYPPLPLQKAAFQDANVCLFVFDCIYFNDVSLMDR